MTKHRSLAGKFIAEPLRTVGEILTFGRIQETGCILPPKVLPFGYDKQGVWYVQVADNSKPTGRTKRSAITEIFKHYYPYNTQRWFISHKLRKTCNTAGCLNYRHYEMVNSCGRTFGEMYMANEQIINLLTSALLQDEVLSFGDASSAESFRMHIYRLKRKWKKEGSPYHERFEDVVIKKDKLHDNMLEFTTRSRSFDDVLARFGNKPFGSVEEPMSVEEKEYLDIQVSGRDMGREVLENLGYAITAPPAGKPTYEQVNQKAIAFSMMGGEPLTPEEEEVLAAGPEEEERG